MTIMKRKESGLAHKALSVCCTAVAVVLMSTDVAIGVETNVYLFERRFKPTTNRVESATIFNIIKGVELLTNQVVGKFSIITNEAFSTEFEGVSWGQSSFSRAWTNVLSGSGGYPMTIANYDEIFDDPGWIKGTKSAYDSYGAYMWILQNSLSFKSSPELYTNAGRIYLIEKVFVGTLGDFPPSTNISLVFPKMNESNTNYPECVYLTNSRPADNSSETIKYTFDTTAYYKLILPVDLDGKDAVTEDEVCEAMEESSGVIVLSDSSTPHAKLIARGCGSSGYTRILSFSDYSKVKVNGASVSQVITVSAASDEEVTYSITQKGAWNGGDTVTATLTVKKDNTIIGIDKVKLTALRVDLIANYDRDSDIDDEDRQKARLEERFYFWINDDNDSGYEGGDDIPEKSGLIDPPDYNNDKVDGVRDLIDFFPVFVDIKDTLTILPGSEYDYILKHEDGSLNAFATNLKPESQNTDLKPDAFLRSLNFGNAYGEFDVSQVTAQGLTLPQGFLDEITYNDRGVVLLEGRSATTKPLVLEIRRKSDSATVLETKLELSIDGIEEMFRHKNLRGVGNGGEPDRLGEPSNYPDSLTVNKHFIFVHGYSVNGDSARGWQSEVFKRMFWSGSKAKFHGISWYGDDTQLFSKFTPNYHVNVRHALETAPNVAAYINGLQGSVAIAGHSLGNMVVSSAVHDHNANVSKYYMVNAAVAIEAYDPSSQDLEAMRQPDWTDYEARLRCSEWHKLFSEPDHRSELSWCDRLGNVAPVAYNFYSPGEDVLARHIGDIGPFSGGWFSPYAWAKQEKLKGRMPVNIGGSTYGGWGFNDAYGSFVWDEVWEEWDWDPTLSPEEAAQLWDYELRSKPFFRPGGSAITPLYVPEDPETPDQGSDFAQTNHAQLLSEMIPAISLAAGLYPVGTLDEPTQSHNFDMQNTMKNGWPQERLNSGWEERWRHSDFREIAYLYVYKVFDEFVNLGGLNQ